MGASNSIRELVKEREVYRRERAVGLSTTAYLGSKVLVLSAITAVQAAVLTGVGLLTRFPTSGALLTHAAWLEMIVTVAALAVASAMFGLVLSALVDNADKTLPPLVVFVMANLVFTGGLLALADKVGLNQLSWLFPARWGFAAAAATTDLNHVMGSDTPAGKAQGLVVDSLWEHSAGTYLIDLAGLLVLGVVSLVVTALLLRRLDPQRPSRRPATTGVSSWLPPSWLPQSGQPQVGTTAAAGALGTAADNLSPYQRNRDHRRSVPPKAGPSRSWRPRSWRSWLVIALVASALLIGGDRAAAAIAGYQIRDRVAGRVDGARGRVRQPGGRRGGRAVPAPGGHRHPGQDQDLDDRPAPCPPAPVARRRSRSPRWTSSPPGCGSASATSCSASPRRRRSRSLGTAVITYATLDDLVKLPGLSLAGVHFSESEGALRFEALGALAPVQAVAEITVEEGLLRIRLRDARFDSRVLPPLGKELLNQILAATIDLSMPALPLGLALQSVTPGPDGLSISVVGHDVPLTAGA